MQQKKWWGPVEFSLGEALWWKFGDRSIAIQRQMTEWQVWNHEADFDSLAQFVIEKNVSDVPSDSDTLSRFVQKKTGNTLEIRPALADRSVVARPASPLSILPGEDVNLYISTPVWFQAVIQDENKAVLADIPIQRPSDTWFGPNSMKGELCYGKYTSAVSDRSQVVERCHRANTTVRVLNHSSKVLLLERLSVPVPLLSLLADAQHQLWTSSLSIIKKSDDELVELHLNPAQQSDMKGAQKLNEPRTNSEKNILVRTIGSLFS